jgi:AraC-like DNA-binding protein
MTITVRAGGMLGYPGLMRSLGHDPAPLLARCGLSEAILADEDRLVPVQSAYDLMALSVETTGLSDFGLRAAQVQDVGALGPLALAMQNAPTVAASIDYLTRYLSVQSPACAMSLHPHSARLPGTVELRYDPSAKGRMRYGPQVVDHGLGLAHLTLRLLAGDRYALRGVSLTTGPTGSTAAHARFFGVPIHDSQPFDALHLSPSMLGAPVVAARPTLLRIAADYLQRHAPTPDAAIAKAVRRAIMHSLAHSRLDRTAIAGLLGLHPRTLQRRLDAEGTSFDTLRDDVRREAALRYLADSGYAIAEVAGLVGFSEQSAFTRWCRSKLDGTPTEVRARRRE